MTRLTASICRAATILTGLCCAHIQAQNQTLPNLYAFPNASGVLTTYNAGGGPIDLTGPFFQPLGTNGRNCGSCHRPAQGWSLSSDELKVRFNLTHGRDPVFRAVDGANCDHNIDLSTVEGRRHAFSLLLNRGLIRIQLAVPANAEFSVLSVVNPYGCGDTTNLSMYRRPLPTTNLRYQAVVMWDGRESSTQTGTLKITAQSTPADLLSNLAHQTMDATSIHAEGNIPLTAAQQRAIVDFEMALSTAQAYDNIAGPLDQNGALGGPSLIDSKTNAAFFVGINDPLGGNPQGTVFSSVIFSLFDAWADGRTASQRPFDNFLGGTRRSAIARGQVLFNTRPINITGVAGLNDDLNLATIPGFCGTCHDSPNIGNHSVAAPLNIGVGDLNGPLDVTYLPVFTLQNKTTHEIKTTTDPGRALITGLWKDVGRMKGPILRGLASRAPYFHNGAAKTLADVVEFYDKRFNIGFTAGEKADLVAFLSSL